MVVRLKGTRREKHAWMIGFRPREGNLTWVFNNNQHVEFYVYGEGREVRLVFAKAFQNSSAMESRGTSSQPLLELPSALPEMKGEVGIDWNVNHWNSRIFSLAFLATRLTFRDKIRLAVCMLINK
jgi:hypothetical protein